MRHHPFGFEKRSGRGKDEWAFRPARVHLDALAVHIRTDGGCTEGCAKGVECERSGRIVRHAHPERRSGNGRCVRLQAPCVVVRHGEAERGHVGGAVPDKGDARPAAAPVARPRYAHRARAGTQAHKHGIIRCEFAHERRRIARRGNGFVVDPHFVHVARKDDMRFEGRRRVRNVAGTVRDESERVASSLYACPERSEVERLLVVSRRNLLASVRIAPSVRDKVNAGNALCGGEVDGERDVHISVVRPRDAEGDMPPRPLCAHLLRSLAPPCDDGTRRARGKFADGGVGTPRGKFERQWRQLGPVRERCGETGRAHVRGNGAAAEKVVVIAAVCAREASGRREGRCRHVAPEEAQQAIGAIDGALVAREPVQTEETVDVHRRVGGTGILAHAADGRVEHPFVKALHACIERILATIRLAEEDKVDGVHEGDIRVGTAYTVVEAALDGEFAEKIELCALAGCETVAKIACDKRALLHTEIDGVEIHHETVAHVPAEVSVTARSGGAVLQLGRRIEEYVELVETGIRAQKAVDTCEQPHARKAAVAPFRLANDSVERPLRPCERETFSGIGAERRNKRQRPYCKPRM